MIIPPDAYETGILTVLSADEFEARQTVDDYNSIRRICLTKKTHMLVQRFVYLLAAIPLVLHSVPALIEHEPTSFLFWMALAIYGCTAFCVLFLKNLRIPAFFLPFFLAESLFIGNWTDLFTIVLPLFSLGILTYFYEKNRRYLTSHPAYPDFRRIEVKVLRDEMSNERSVPLRGVTEDNSHADLLSDLGDPDAPPAQPLAERNIPAPSEPEEDPYADILSTLS